MENKQSEKQNQHSGSTNIMKKMLANQHDNDGHDHENVLDMIMNHNIDENDDNHMKNYINTYKHFHQKSYIDILKRLQPGEKFTDKSFPPEISSLTKDLKKFAKCKNFVWRRGSEFQYGSIQMKVFEGKIEPDDIRQGGLGDCYFLSSLSALAEYQNLISRIFEQKNFNDAGCYSVWLCHDGEFKPVIIDDYFPCVSKEGGPAFSRGHGPELWVLLIEKAYAKIYGTYDRIEAGLTGDAIRDLTGAPYEWKNTSEDDDIIWEFIRTSDQNKYIMTAGSQQAKGNEVEKDLGKGIVSSHAYAILDTQLVISEGREERILQLRNPWGTGEWKGDWSDNSSKWTPELRKRLNVQDIDDGIFWIRIDDFCKQFSEVTVSKLHQDYIYTYIKIKNIKDGKKFALIPIEIHQDDTHGYFNLTQPDKRNFAKLDRPYEYSFLQMFIVNEDFSQFIDAEKTFGKELHVQVKLNKGKYFALIEVDWHKHNMDVHSLVLSAYTNIKVDFTKKEIDLLDESKALKILDKILLLIKPSDEKNVKQYPEDKKIERIFNQSAGYVYWLYINKSTTGTLMETIELRNRKFLEICLPEKDSNKFQVVVAPQHAKIIKYKIMPNGRGQYSYSCLSGNTVDFSDESMINNIKKHSKSVKQRQWQGQEVEIYQYAMFTTHGLVLYWENRTSKKYYEEQREGDDKSIQFNQTQYSAPTVIVKLQPGKGQLAKFEIVDPNQGVSYGMSIGFKLS